MRRIDISYKNRITILVIAIVTLMVIASGCATYGRQAGLPGEEPVGLPGEEPAMMARPRAHLWKPLYKIGEEPSDYAIYTYVLINSDKTDFDAWSRYEKLVEAITSSTLSVEDYSLDFNPSDYNLFLIPCSEKKEGDETESLNDSLSQSIMTKIGAEANDENLRKTAMNPGPFLISVIKPIGIRGGEYIDMLYVDLTRTNEAAMTEIVAAYKNRLTDSTIQGVKRFLSVRLALLNIILDADDYIHLVKVTYADLLPE
ncbi:MAG: hypothetical protein ACMUIL_01765 [bacterium]